MNYAARLTLIAVTGIVMLTAARAESCSHTVSTRASRSSRATPTDIGISSDGNARSATDLVVAFALLNSKKQNSQNAFVRRNQ